MPYKTNQHPEPGPFCQDRRDDIVTYIFDEMGPGAGEAFEAHLDSCEACREEVESLRGTLALVEEAGIASTSSHEGEAISWEDEWTLLRRRLMSNESFEGTEVLPFPPAPARRSPWLARAAAVILTAGLAFSAGYVVRGRSAPGEPSRPQAGAHAPAPVSGASVGNYFDSLDDFERDTHNFLRRSRMILMEFTNIGTDSDPRFFRDAAPELMAEASRYREVARRMQNRKLVDLLDQIEGILKSISAVDTANLRTVLHDVKSTLDTTGLIATLEILDANIERDLRGQSHV